MVRTYRICPNRSPGVYFLPESFDLATIQARLLFEPQQLLTVRLFLCHTKHYMQYKMWTTWPQQVGSSHGTVEKESVVREHHVYKAIWTPAIREELLTRAPASIYETLCSGPVSIRAPACIWARLLFGQIQYIHTLGNTQLCKVNVSLNYYSWFQACGITYLHGR